MLLSEMEVAIGEAEQTIRNSRRAIVRMVSMVSGRLRYCGAWGADLKKLKKELRDYNIHTGCWKDK